MNAAAAEGARRSHVPMLGVNVAALDPVDVYAAIMAISLAAVDRCDAILVIGESPGANRERDLVAAKGLPVYRSIEEVPDAGCPEWAR